jgi:hypothetical protein
MTSTDLQTEFLLQFWKQYGKRLNHTTGYQQTTTTMTGQRNKERQKGKRKTKGKDRQGKTINKWGLQEAPHLQDPKQNHSENAKSGNSKQEFFFKKQPL